MLPVSKLPHLDEATLRSFGIATKDVIASLEKLLVAAQSSEAWCAPKAILQPPDGRYIMATLAAMSDPSLVVTKTVTLNERNLDAGLAPINGLVSVLNGETGIPELTIDGNWITEIRTAALSALAAKYMANPTSSTVGFVGSGLQARSHLRAFADLFPLKSIKIFGRGQKNIDALQDIATQLGLSAHVSETPRDAVEGVDLVVTSVTHTSVSEPFLDAAWLGEGSFATLVDLGATWHRSSFGLLDVLAVDDLKQEAALAQKLADPKDVSGDLTGLVAGHFSGRASPSQRTAFVFRGHAIGDLALASVVYKKFREQG